MIRRPPRSTRTDTLFPTRRSSDLRSAPFGVPAFQVRTAIGEEVYPRDVATFHHAVERALPGRIIAAVDDGRSGSVKKFLGLQCILIAHRLEELIADRKSTRLHSSHSCAARVPSPA